MICSRGDVVLVWFPNSDLQTFKRRPALVVQADSLGTGLPQVVAAQISSNLSRLGHPSRVSLLLSTPEGAASGLRGDSVVMADSLATILEKAVDRVTGQLPDMTAVDAALRHTLGL